MKRYDETKLGDFSARLSILAIRLEHNNSDSDSKTKAENYLEVVRKMKTIRSRTFLAMMGEKNTETELWKKIMGSIDEEYENKCDDKDLEDLASRLYEALKGYDENKRDTKEREEENTR